MKGERPRALMIHNSTGSSIYRILPQAKYLQTQGWDVRVRGLNAGKRGGVPDKLLKWADIVILEMAYSVEFLRAIKRAGAKIVYELDDMMEKVPKKHYAYKDTNWWRTYMTYKCLSMSDAISCTVKPLLDRYKWFNQNIRVLPNYLDYNFWKRDYLPNESDKLRIGWIGGNSHREDLEFIAPIIEKIVNKYDNVKFVCCGYGGTSSPDKWVEFNYGHNVFKNIPTEKYEFSLGVPMEVFPDKIPSLRLDIAVAPVVEHPFSKCKSNCKSLEYGLNRIPGVYQRFLYKDSVIDGKTGFLADTQDDFYNRLCELISMSKEKRIKMGKDAEEHIEKNFMFHDYAHKWEELYKSVISDK